MDGWGVSTQKDDAIKYEHDEITCETIFGLILPQHFRAYICADKIDVLVEALYQISSEVFSLQ